MLPPNTDLNPELENILDNFQEKLNLGSNHANSVSTRLETKIHILSEVEPYHEKFWFLAIEKFLAFLGLILLAPLLLLTALSLKITSGKGPVLFRQERLGKSGKTFMINKFRSMHLDAESSGPFICTSYKDARITKTGRFLRQTKIDELPQLVNVLVGDMSFIGPRPERAVFHKKNQWISNWNRRLDYRPGITGLAQISRHISHNPEQKIHADLCYAAHRTLQSDLWLIIMTVLPFLKREKLFGIKLK